MRFVIISSGVNCVSFIHACLQSVKNQRFQDWIAVFIDDGSTDRTTHFLHSKQKDDRFVIETHLDNAGAAKRRFDAIKKYATRPDDVILLLGMDDSLMPDALTEIKQQYDRGKWMTYGNWIDSNDFMLPDGFLHFPDEVHAARSYRSASYRSTAPNTFKRFLFDQMTENDFKFNGEWVRATTESNLMISCLEMCGKDRIGVIEKPIYRYNKRGKQSTRNVRGRTYQNMVYQDVMNRPKKQKYEGITERVA